MTRMVLPFGLSWRRSTQKTAFWSVSAVNYVIFIKSDICCIRRWENQRSCGEVIDGVESFCDQAVARAGGGGYGGAAAKPGGYGGGGYGQGGQAGGYGQAPAFKASGNPIARNETAPKVQNYLPHLPCNQDSGVLGSAP